jgi:hypothetical protein
MQLLAELFAFSGLLFHIILRLLVDLLELALFVIIRSFCSMQYPLGQLDSVVIC